MKTLKEGGLGRPGGLVGSDLLIKVVIHSFSGREKDTKNGPPRRRAHGRARATKSTLLPLPTRIRISIFIIIIFNTIIRHAYFLQHLPFYVIYYIKCQFLHLFNLLLDWILFLQHQQQQPTHTHPNPTQPNFNNFFSSLF